MAVIAGIHLAGFASPLSRLEKLGMPVWRRIQPLAAHFFPARSWPQAYAAGLAWGLLPCGLVYGALAAAVFSGGAAHGAVAMAAFGAGTLPRLFFAGVAAAKLRGWTGLATLRRLSGLGGSVWQTLACF